LRGADGTIFEGGSHSGGRIDEPCAEVEGRVVSVAGVAGEKMRSGEGRDCEAEVEESVAMCGEGWG
jgi:hypothetical protein